MAWSSSFVYSMFLWIFLGSYRSPGLCQVPMWIPVVSESGKILMAVSMSMSLAAAGEAGWKRG
jgi:hypothetical protein